MCEKCFTKEYDKFSTFQEFEDFKYELESKLLKGNGLFLLRACIYERGVLVNIHTDVLVNIYKCKNCETKWYLNISEEDGLGFFLKENNYKKRLTINIKVDVGKSCLLPVLILFLAAIAIAIFTSF